MNLIFILFGDTECASECASVWNKRPLREMVLQTSQKHPMKCVVQHLGVDLID